MLSTLLEGALAYLFAPRVSPVEAQRRVLVCGGCQHLTWAATPLIARVGGYCGVPIRGGPGDCCGCLVGSIDREGLTGSKPARLTVEGLARLTPKGKTECEGEACPLGKWA